jgi:nucleoside-diphosphate-sugar epimerase
MLEELMKILIVGASGVLGRALIPNLAGHEVVGTTRSREKRSLLEALGAVAVECDVYRPGAVERVAQEVAPDILVNFLTDLAGGPGPANSRVRREGGPVVVRAAQQSGARRLVVESIAFEVPPDAAAAVQALEQGALDSGLEAIILRFGRLWGPGTWSESAPAPPAISVTEAGRRGAPLVLGAPPGIHVVAEGT